MTKEAVESEVVDERPVAKKRLSLVVVLAMVLGVLLLLGVVAVIWHVQTSKALKSEVLALKKELKAKEVTYEDLKDRLDGLSEQFALLKDKAVASSSGSSETAAGEPVTGEAQSGVAKLGQAEAKLAQVEAKLAQVEAKSALAEARPASVESEPVSVPRVKKPKSDKPNCELVGKTKEEQEETLKRCVSLIDLPK